MPGQFPEFPAFIRATYDASGDGFAEFVRRGRSAGEQVRDSLRTAEAEIRQFASRAISQPINQSGAFNLGTQEMRAASAAADARAAALRNAANAADALAAREAHLSGAQQAVIQATRAEAAAAETDAASQRERLLVYEQLQAEMNRTAARTGAMIGANHALATSQGVYTNSARASRFAMVQVGQQLQDVAIQAQMGTSALTILVQQGSQLGFAMSQMTGRAAAFGRFIAGPWGTALFLGTAAVGYLTTAMNRSAEAADLAKHATDGLSTAQSALGNLFDLTTGKLRDQSGALREHIELMRLQIQVTAIQLELEGRRQQQEAARLFREGMEPVSIGETIGALGYRGPGGPRGALGVVQRQAEEQRNLLRNIQSAQQAMDAATTGAARTRAAAALQAARDAAIAAARRPGFGTAGGISPEDFIQGVLGDAQGRANQRIAELTRQSLERGQLDPALQNRGRDRRERQDHRPEQAAASLEQIQRLNEQWDEQPRLVDRAVQAVRELDHILTEAQRRKLPRFDEMRAGAEQAQRSIREGLIRQITEGFSEAPKLIQRAGLAIEQLNAAAEHFPQMAPQIEAAGQAVQNALLRPYRDVLENLVQQADQQDLIAQGRSAEAQALGVIRQLEDQLGDIGEERRRTIIAGTVALEEQARQYEIIRGRQQAYLRVSESVRSSLVDIVADPSGTGGALSSITQAFNRLGAEMTVENLFGDIFRRLDDRVTGRDRVREENLNYASAISNLRTEIGTLRDAEAQHRQSLDQVIGSLGRFESAIDSAAAHLSRAPGLVAAAGRVLPGLPVAGPITNTYSQHLARGSHGLDIAAALGTPITTRASGRVLTVGYDSASGYNVIIDHGGGIVSSYSHLIRQSPLRQGQAVGAGQLVGNVGETGHATGPHLHYRVKVNGRDVDPATFRFPEQMAQAAAQLTRAQAALDPVLRGVAALYPRLAQYLPQTVIRRGTARDGRQLEFYPPWESDNPSPGNLTVELFNRRLRGRNLSDSIGLDMLHYLGSRTPQGAAVDPTYRALKDAMIEAIRTANRPWDREAYGQERRAGLAGASYDAWLENNRADAYIRGLVSPRMNPEWQRPGTYTPEMQRIGQQIRQYLQTPADDLATSAAGAATGLRDLNSIIAGLSDVAPGAATSLATVTSNVSAMHETAHSLAVNDNEIPGATITGRRGNIAAATADLDPRQFARLMATELAKRVFGEEFGARIGGAMADALEGAAVGSQYGNLLRGAGVRVPNGLAEGIGALANNLIPGFAQAAGRAMPFIGAGMAITSGLSHLFGIKNHAGGLFGIGGNILIDALTPAKRGSATYGGGTRGNNKAFVTASSEALDSVTATIERIAEAFGASVNVALGHASIGIRNGSYRFDPTGQGITKTKKGAIDFGEDREAAVRAAVLDLIRDGVIEGLRQGSQNLLKATKDIDSGLQKALDFEGVFTDLKRRLDPVGAALDETDKRFKHLEAVFKEAGASAEEYAQLEQLYQLERTDAVKQAGEAMTSALKSLLDDLTVNNDARSLRERLAEAHARYDPLAARVAAGDKSVDYDAFAAAARLVEQLTRQIEGSTNPYFEVLDEITRLTQGALSDQENLISIASARTGVLGGGTAATEPTVSAIDRLGGLLVEQLGGELSAVNDNLGSLIRLASGTGGGSVSSSLLERLNY